MISNQVLQTTIDGLKNITRIDICIMDTEGKALATTINNIEEYEEAVMAFVDSPADSQVLQGYQFFKVFDEHQLEYVILAKGDSDDVYMVGKLAAFQIQNLLVAYKERYDKDNFIKNLLLDNLLLVDTGGHYLEGTTDITRTILIGNKATEEQKKYYTAVLRGNLNLCDAHFLYGCSGVSLDYIARKPLWDMGCDYNHGTGHGTGYLLNVHEPPNSFGENTVFEEGMVTSDEPGIYLEGKFGIRLENLILCVKREKTVYGQFMGFEPLTFVPFDKDLIEPRLLDNKERELLNNYHRKVYENISPYLDKDEKEWLENACSEI